MPSSLQTLDTSFPKIDNHQTTEENFLQVTNYLYMLLENLRYTLGNLGVENINDTELDSIAQLIREPVWARIEDAEGNINTLNVTAENLLSQISSLDGSMSAVQQTSNTLMTRVQNVEGDLSSLTQTVSGFRLSVKNGESSSTISLTANGTTINSQTIQLTGMVTFSDLSTSGKTTINGNNITTGTIMASRIKLYGAMTVYTTSGGTTPGGSLGYTKSNLGGGSGMFMMATSGGEVAVTTSGAAMRYLAADNQIYIGNGTAGVVVTSSSADMGYYFQPGSFRAVASTANLGTSAAKWGAVYATTGTIQTSDRNQKHSIEPLPEKYLNMFDLLTVYRYKLDSGTSDRYHVGFVAQDVEGDMRKAQIDSQEFGGFVTDVDENGNTIYMLRYEEFIGILAAKIKQLEERIA